MADNDLTSAAFDDKPPALVRDGKLVCPYRDCAAEDQIIEIDVATRTNELTIEGPGRIKVGLGDGRFDHECYECAQCVRPVSLPDGHELVYP
ncbi:hypothetical protein [Nonomuraea jabiensis]|uniref:hypothetical protein n=1 Tax=Nonomuraea jabiensis TaxID=882448 RepID=UPI003D745A68